VRHGGRQEWKMKKNRVWGLMLMAVVSGLIGGMISSYLARSEPAIARESHPEKIYEAEAFVLLDKEGKARARLFVKVDGQPMLAFYGKNGRTNIALTLTPEGSPGAVLMDQEGGLRAELGLEPDGSPNLVFWDQKDKTRTKLGLMGNGESALVFYGKKLKDTPTVWLTSLMGLMMMDNDGSPRAHIVLNAEGEPSISLLDKGNKKRAVLGSVDLSNQLAESVEKRSSSSLVLFNKDERVLWKVP
jgi:hypothetical protein